MRKIWFGNDVLDEQVLLALQYLGASDVLAITKEVRSLLVENKHVKYPAIELSADEAWVQESLARLVENKLVTELKMGTYRLA